MARALNPTPGKTCFIAMPITTHPHEKEIYRDAEHWQHVIDHLLVPAVESAGFVPIRPSTSGTNMIHGRIIRHLIEADMVLCDVSQNNPNVFFELGVRTSLDKPIALIMDDLSKLPFDVAGLNTHPYSAALDIWDLEREIASMSEHIKSSHEQSSGRNPLWEHFGFTIAAEQPREATQDAASARFELMAERLQSVEELLREQARPIRARSNEVRHTQANESSLDVSPRGAIASREITVDRVNRVLSGIDFSYITGVRFNQNYDDSMVVHIATELTDSKGQEMRLRAIRSALKEVGVVTAVETLTPGTIELTAVLI